MKASGPATSEALQFSEEALEPKDEELPQHNRPKTMSRREMQREVRQLRRAGELLPILEEPRPKSRKECAQGPRPCMFVSCKHHLYLDVNPETGSIKLNFPDKEVWELKETCALDVAEKGGITLEEVGEILNLTRERVRQIESIGFSKLGKCGLHTFLEKEDKLDE